MKKIKLKWINGDDDVSNPGQSTCYLIYNSVIWLINEPTRILLNWLSSLFTLWVENGNEMIWIMKG